MLEQKYSVETGTVFKINTKEKKLFNEQGDEEMVDLSSSFNPQKVEFMKAGGSYAIVFGKKLQSFACETLDIELKCHQLMDSNGMIGKNLWSIKNTIESKEDYIIVNYSDLVNNVEVNMCYCPNTFDR